MESVCDDFGAHGGVTQYELEHAALHGCSESAADGRDGAHGAPEVIHMGHASAVGGRHFGPGCVGVSAGHQATSTFGSAIEIEATVEFGSAGGDADLSCLEVGFEFVASGVAAPFLFVTA